MDESFAFPSAFSDELKAAHEAFKAVYAEREKARAGKNNIPTDKAATKLLQEAQAVLQSAQGFVPRPAPKQLHCLAVH